MPIHGGNLAEAAAQHGRPATDWLDPSTGINAVAYPVPAVADTAWQRLPQPDRETALEDAARRAYAIAAGKALVAAPGTQALIQLLPALPDGGPTSGDVVIRAPTYAEHAHVWRGAGFTVRETDELGDLGGARVVVVVNPNNPDGRRFAPNELLAATDDLRRSGGVVVLDEAFADVAPETSLCPVPTPESRGVVCLRSFGKFFGLAGMRLGFAVGDPAMIARLRARLGPWAVAGPAIEVGIAALDDAGWIARTRADLDARAARLDAILAAAGPTVIGGTTLYRLVDSPRATAIHHGLAAAGIWTRRFADRPGWLRFGIPGSDADFHRLTSALDAVQPVRA